jgi:hypothetical protein
MLSFTLLVESPPAGHDLACVDLVCQTEIIDLEGFLTGDRAERLARFPAGKFRDPSLELV